MPIEFACQCGARFAVNDDMAGKRARCQACQAIVRIPAVAPAPVPVPVRPPAATAPVYAAAVRSAPRPLASQPPRSLADQIPPGPRDLLAAAAPATAPDAAMDRQVEFAQNLTQSAASNPGRLRISHIKHWMSFPAWPTGWAVGLTVALIMTVLLHWGFACLAVPLAALNWLYWWVQRNKFASGCVNPSVVVALDPPLVAVLTNLTKGATETKWDYVKIVPQPLGSMTGGPPQPGQRLASVAVYEDSPSIEHWHDFYPVVVNCVSFSQTDIARVQGTIEPADWQELEAAIRQLPQPPVAGLYKVEMNPRARRLPHSRQVLTAALDESLIHAPDKGVFRAQFGIPPQLWQAASAIIAPGVNGQDALALVLADGDPSGQTGLVLADAGVYFRFSDQLRGAFRWTDLCGAGYARDGFEVVLSGGQRWRWGKGLGEHSLALEALLDGLAKAPEPAFR